MNLILFEPSEIGRAIPLGDPRAAHLRTVLGREAGAPFDAGIVNGPRGRARVVAVGAEGLTFAFEPSGEAPPPESLRIIVALPRPQTARKILSAATTLGVGSIDFFASEKGEPGYASSTLWSSGEWRRHLVDGAAQAFDTRIPEVARRAGLAEALDAAGAVGPGVALDNYEATRRLTPAVPAPAVLAFGPERGWSAAERDLLRARGYVLAHLGPRVLRTETAVVAALAILKALG